MLDLFEDKDKDDTNEKINEFTAIPMDIITPSNPNYVKYLISSENITNALNSLASLKCEFESIEQALLIQLSIENVFEELNHDKLSGLVQIFSTKSVVVYLKNNKSVMIYWKSKDIDYFLSLASPKKLQISECSDVYEFLANFLVDSLSKSHLGIQRRMHEHNANSNEIELIQLADSNNLNILQLTAERGDTKSVKILLDLGIFEDTPYEFYNAPSLALSGKQYPTLLLLMEGNFTFPPLMDTTKLTSELQLFIQGCEDLREAVIAKNVIKVQEILKENPHRRHFYNKNNQSVLKVALEKKLHSMYEILLSNDISFGPHEHFARIFAGLSESDKTVLREIHFRCSKDLPEHYMNVLMMNTSISHDDMEKEGKEKLILRAYRFLNKNPSLNPILKVVAASPGKHSVPRPGVNTEHAVLQIKFCAGALNRHGADVKLVP